MSAVATITENTLNHSNRLALNLSTKGSEEVPSAGLLRERKEAKEKLAAAYRIFHKLGYDYAIAGHITLRDPINPKAFWLAPFSLPFDHVCASDLLLIDHNGNILEGGKPGDGQLFNAAGFAIHSALHMGREDVHAAAHAHSQFGKAFSALGRNLDITDSESGAFSETIKLYDQFGGVVLTDEESQRIVRAAGANGKAMILRNHGILSLGETIEAALAHYVQLEECCESQLLADAAGGGVALDFTDEQHVFAEFGTEARAHRRGAEMIAAMDAETGGDHKL